MPITPRPMTAQQIHAFINAVELAAQGGQPSDEEDEAFRKILGDPTEEDMTAMILWMAKQALARVRAGQV